MSALVTFVFLEVGTDPGLAVKLFLGTVHVVLLLKRHFSSDSVLAQGPSPRPLVATAQQSSFLGVSQCGLPLSGFFKTFTAL